MAKDTPPLEEPLSEFQPTAEYVLWLELGGEEPSRIVGQILEHCCHFKVSDLFFCAEEKYFSVSARHLGMWRRVGQLPAEIGKRCLAYIKGQAKMDITERRRPIDGRWIYRRPGGQIIDLRINTIPTLYGEDCTLRLLDRSVNLLDIDHLGLMQRDMNSLLFMLNSPSGLILVTGPTGSGKTTTLYACLNYLNNGLRKINTIEDPVEYALAGVRQSQTNAAIDLGFADLLRSILRQAPDVIMVGEIRDAETALTAMRAASSGHLVLATLHAPSAPSAIPALVNLGVSPHHLASCSIGIVAQRLLRTLNPTTKVAYDLSLAATLFDEIEDLLDPGQQCFIYGPAVDPQPGEPAYTDRTGVFEILAMSKAIRSLIIENAATQVIRRKAIEEGMIEMRQAALLALARGQTSIEEVFRAIPSDLLIEE